MTEDPPPPLSRAGGSVFNKVCGKVRILPNFEEFFLDIHSSIRRGERQHDMHWLPTRSNRGALGVTQTTAIRVAVESAFHAH